jgi:hypothetical protein
MDPSEYSPSRKAVSSLEKTICGSYGTLWNDPSPELSRLWSGRLARVLKVGLMEYISAPEHFIEAGITAPLGL